MLPSPEEYANSLHQNGTQPVLKTIFASTSKEGEVGLNFQLSDGLKTYFDFKSKDFAKPHDL